VSGGQWRPADATDRPEAHRAADPLLRALEGAIGSSSAHRWGLSLERERLAGRSDMYIVRAESPHGTPVRWVVKRPHIDWTQDDVGSPLTARQEFDALRRLHAHFEGIDGFRVPVPVAYLPDLDAFAMEYVDGVTIKELLTYRSALRPRELLDGLAAAGTFLRHLHALEEHPPLELDLADEAQAILAVAEEKLHPLGLSLPEPVRRTLVHFPALKVTSPQVRLHGDFGPANILRAASGGTVGLDAALQSPGIPEDDLVRFVALVSGVIRLAPEIVASPLSRIRQELENRLLNSYYLAEIRPPLFELRYLHQLVRRWCRLRELAQQHEANAALTTRLKVITWQMQMLMTKTDRRLVQSLAS
jgi:aminoglycoside phosphotransferase (APT) family kinase protein